MIVLEFERQPLRLLMFGDRIWCAIEDLSSALSEPLPLLLSYLEADERTEIPTENGDFHLWANELGLYNLIHTLSNPVAKRLKQWLRQEAIPSLRQSSMATTSISPPEALAIAIPILERNLGVDPERMGIWLLSQYRQIYPTHADIFVDIRTLSSPPAPTPIASTFAPPEELVLDPLRRLIPKELGQLLSRQYALGYSPSPQKVNLALAALNLQVSIPTGTGKEWKLTQTGQRYGRLETCVDRHHKNRTQIRWSPELVPIIAQQLGWI
jgi:hypothetical protein